MFMRIVIFGWLLSLLFYAPLEAPNVIETDKYIQIEKTDYSLFYLIITDFFLYFVVFVQALYIFLYSVKNKKEHFMNRYFSLANVIMAFAVLFVYLVVNLLEGHGLYPYDAFTGIMIVLFVSWIIYRKKKMRK